MKQKYFFLIALAIALAITGCQYVEYDDSGTDGGDGNGTVTEQQSRVVLRSAAGFASNVDSVYVEKDVQTVLLLEAKNPTDTISSANWSIGSQSFTGTQIVYKPTSLGKISGSVTVTFKSGYNESRTFFLVSVIDISKVDPVKMWATKNANNSWDFLVLFSKNRVRGSLSSAYSFNGQCIGWQGPRAIPEEDRSYILDSNGNPQRTTDVGKYVGARFTLDRSDDYNIALIYGDGLWADLSGSEYVDAKKNVGLANFYFDQSTGKITPRGGVSGGGGAANIPGANGDAYFRFEGIGDSISLYFKVDTVANTSFYVRQTVGGAYTNPVRLSVVPGNYSGWALAKLPLAEAESGITSIRFGKNIQKPLEVSPNMPKSMFYDSYFKAIRMLVVGL